MDGRSSTTAGEDRIEVEGGALMMVCSDLWVDKIIHIEEIQSIHGIHHLNRCGGVGVEDGDGDVEVQVDKVIGIDSIFLGSASAYNCYKA